MKGWVLAAVVALGAMSCPAPQPDPPGDCDGPPEGYLTSPPDTLSAWCLLELKQGAVTPLGRARVYTLNTPLFSDYTEKTRIVWVPKDQKAEYTAEGALAFPVGAVIAKTFAMPADLRKPGEALRVLETRLLIHTEAGWIGKPYVWDAEQTEAKLVPAGGFVDLAWIDSHGNPATTSYLIPNANQCKKCHANDGDSPDLHPLGPTAAQLHHGTQLDEWAAAGILSGLPASSATVPTLPVWNDPATGTVEQRARAYLQVNCAFCHNPTGPARTTGLYLQLGQDSAGALGVCKSPVAAGAGAGQYKYDIWPGKPGESILTFRLRSTDPRAAMPEIGRSVTHEEGVALIEEWIRTMPGQCPP